MKDSPAELGSSWYGKLSVMAALCIALHLGTGNAPARADELPQYSRTQEDGGLVYSLGRPFRILRYSTIFDAGVSIDVPANVEPTGHFRFDFAWDLFNPVVRPVSLIGEVGVGFQSNRYQAMLRAQIGISPLHIAGGIAQRTDPTGPSAYFTLWHPIHRGGVFGDGTLLRLDYLPGHDQTLTLGLEIPISHEARAGQTRPKRSALPIGAPVTEMTETLEPPTPELRAQLDRAREQAIWVYRLTTPPIDKDSEGTFFQSTADYVSTLERYGSTEGLVQAYHSTLSRAFKASCGVPCEKNRDGELWDVARKVLLEEVLIPYDYLLGAYKDPSETLGGFTRTAAGRFAREAIVKYRLTPEQLMPIQRTFIEVLEIISQVRRVALQDWEDSRLVWLPLSLGLLPEDHATQAKLDGLITALTRVKLTAGNSFRNVVSLQFLSLFEETVRKAKNYHVLWIHDYKGVTGKGTPDRAAAWASIEVYLEALIRNVSRYDQTKSLPVYMIFLDQWYYELNQGWIFLKILEEPLTATLSLPAGNEVIERKFKETQERLRKAIGGSKLLQGELSQFGEEWLKNRIKIHVNITNPSDPSFWSNEVLPVVGLADDVMRDHRKIVFYDLREDDPDQGAAIFTGMGIGEEYVSLKWIDRGLELRGPAAIRLKTAAYDLLRQQGVDIDRIPLPLRPIVGAPVRPPDRKDSGANITRVIQLHNPTGFAVKEINPLKAILYTLMPRGSVVFVPDSLWSSPLWASMLAASALRGTRSYVIAPSQANAPGVGFPGISRAHDLFAELILFRSAFLKELAKSGGRIEVGIFSPQTEVSDLKALLALVIEKIQFDPVLKELFPFSESSVIKLKSLLGRLKSGPLPSLADQGEVPKSKLHAKINAAASRETWNWLVGQESILDEYVHWISVLDQSIAALRKAPKTIGLPIETAETFETFVEKIRDQQARLPRRELSRHVSYFTSGSHNSNLRSMLLDGEVLVALTDLGLLIGFSEMISILPRCEWVRDLPGLERYLPDITGWKQSFSRWIQILQ